jgi:hydrogenase-4 component B
MNGFASEWLTYQALVLGSTTPAVHTRVFTLLAGAALALTGALSADCFIKAFGISFLGMPRSEQAEGAVETSFSMKAGMAALAASCLILGVFPGYVLLSISRIGAGGLHLVEKVGMGSSFLVVEGGFSSLSPLALMTLSLSALAVLAAIVRAANRGRRTSYGDSWDCGIRRLTPRMQYTATAFTKPLRVIFKNIYLPTREVKITYRLKPFFAKDITHSSEITPFFERYAYDPAIRAIHLIAGRVRKLQSGSLHLYLGYILITLLILLFAWG